MKERSKSKADVQSFHTPFRELAEMIRRRPEPPRHLERVPRKPDGGADEATAFRAAVQGARPLSREARSRVGPAPPILERSIHSEEAEAMAALNDLVSGKDGIHVSDTDEYVEGIASGTDPRLVEKLRSGVFAWQSHVDLHGLTLEEAHDATRSFLFRALRHGTRCVLIVHGRGRNSPAGRAVLKKGLTRWLAHGELSQVVLAFCSARRCDGGPGATYVLLRRRRKNGRPFRTLEGAKS